MLFLRDALREALQSEMRIEDKQWMNRKRRQDSFVKVTYDSTENTIKMLSRLIVMYFRIIYIFMVFARSLDCLNCQGKWITLDMTINDLWLKYSQWSLLPSFLPSLKINNEKTPVVTNIEIIKCIRMLRTPQKNARFFLNSLVTTLRKKS